MLPRQPEQVHGRAVRRRVGDVAPVVVAGFVAGRGVPVDLEAGTVLAVADVAGVLLRVVVDVLDRPTLGVEHGAVGVGRRPGRGGPRPPPAARSPGPDRGHPPTRRCRPRGRPRRRRRPGQPARRRRVSGWRGTVVEDGVCTISSRSSARPAWSGSAATASSVSWGSRLLLPDELGRLRVGMSGRDRIVAEELAQAWARARDSRGRTTVVVIPRTSAISRGSRPSHRCSSSTSWSRALRRRIAAVTSARWTTRRWCRASPVASSRRSRSPRSCAAGPPPLVRQHLARYAVELFFAESALAGTCASRRQATRKVSAVASAASRAVGAADREAEDRVEVRGVQPPEVVPAP